MVRINKPVIREEMEEMRKKGLCMWCGAKFGSGHRCMRSQLYQMLVEEPEEVSAEPEVFFDCPEILELVPFEDPMISFHALLGIRGPKLCVFKVVLRITKS